MSQSKIKLAGEVGIASSLFSTNKEFPGETEEPSIMSSSTGTRSTAPSHAVFDGLL